MVCVGLVAKTQLPKRPKQINDDDDDGYDGFASDDAVDDDDNDGCLDLVLIQYLSNSQAGTTCGASSQPDLIQNHFLISRMLRFLRHSQQKVQYFNISRQKVTYFNVL